ncbi:MAG: TetR/AcrR family transcriptional regulator [Betaproteobacteria bacterium]|nr:TetR/AcrR family transcriptional regulator [Betaproteobacteria bacterium]
MPRRVPGPPPSPPSSEARQRWLEAGLEALTAGGLEALRIEPIAKRIGLTKGSFYHHFASREAYVEALLEHWEARSTRRIIELAEAAPSLGAKYDRVNALADAVDHHLEIALRGLVRHDARIGAMVNRVDRRRIAYLAALSRDGGADAAQARFLAELGYFAFVGAQHLNQLPHPPQWHTRMRALLTAGARAAPAARRPTRTPSTRSRT